MASQKTSQRERERDAARAARRERERASQVEAVEALRSSAGWQRWLRTRGRFRRYSLGNQLLIALQCPQATFVAGFRKWLELGYCVEKGSRALWIWAPCPPSKKQLAEWERSGANLAERPRTFFKLVTSSRTRWFAASAATATRVVDHSLADLAGGRGGVDAGRSRGRHAPSR
jgi:hypothetical protein